MTSDIVVDISLCRVLHVRREVLVLEVWRKNLLDERIAEKELILAVIEAENHFVQVSRVPQLCGFQGAGFELAPD